MQHTVPNVLRRPGWIWTEKGLQVRVGTKIVHFPLQKVLRIFDQCMARYGVGAAYRVGACMSVGGFFKKISRGIKKSVSKVSKALPPAVHKVIGIAKKVGTVTKNVVTHPAFRAGFAAVAVAFPVLAPAAAGLEVAARVIDKVEKGKAAAKSAAKALSSGKKPSAKDLGAVLSARTAQAGIARMAQRAKAGDPKAKRAMGAVIGATVANRSAKKQRIKQLGPRRNIGGSPLAQGPQRQRANVQQRIDNRVNRQVQKRMAQQVRMAPPYWAQGGAPAMPYDRLYGGGLYPQYPPQAPYGSPMQRVMGPRGGRVGGARIIFR